jgi:hypothetical protein
MPMYSAGGPSMGGGNIGGMRNAITQALMNVQNPQPRTEVPGSGGAPPAIGAPSAPQGIPPGVTTPPSMPGAMPTGGGMPGGMPPPGGMAPGMPPMGAGQMPPPMPGGAPVGPPPRVPNMGPPPVDPTMGTQMPGGPGQLGRY